MFIFIFTFLPKFFGQSVPINSLSVYQIPGEKIFFVLYKGMRLIPTLEEHFVCKGRAESKFIQELHFDQKDCSYGTKLDGYLNLLNIVKQMLILSQDKQGQMTLLIDKLQDNQTFNSKVKFQAINISMYTLLPYNQLSNQAANTLAERTGCNSYRRNGQLFCSISQVIEIEQQNNIQFLKNIQKCDDQNCYFRYWLNDQTKFGLLAFPAQWILLKQNGKQWQFAAIAPRQLFHLQIKSASLWTSLFSLLPISIIMCVLFYFTYIQPEKLYQKYELALNQGADTDRSQSESQPESDAQQQNVTGTVFDQFDIQ